MMEVYSWLSPISTKNELMALIKLVEEGEIEEFFIAQSLDKGVAGESWNAGQILIFSFSSGDDLQHKVEEICPCINMETIPLEFFDEIDGVFTLKWVFYPESDMQEEQIIAQLV
jgi:hypothetical protein